MMLHNLLHIFANTAAAFKPPLLRAFSPLQDFYFDILLYNMLYKIGKV